MIDDHDVVLQRERERATTPPQQTAVTSSEKSNAYVYATRRPTSPHHPIFSFSSSRCPILSLLYFLSQQECHSSLPRQNKTRTHIVICIKTVEEDCVDSNLNKFQPFLYYLILLINRFNLINSVNANNAHSAVRLHTRRVKHHPNPSSNTLRWQISSKLASHDTIISMRAAYPAPVHTKLGSILDSRCLGNECYALSEVELNIFLGVNSLNFNEGGVVVLIA